MMPMGAAGLGLGRQAERQLAEERFAAAVIRLTDLGYARDHAGAWAVVTATDDLAGWAMEVWRHHVGQITTLGFQPAVARRRDAEREGGFAPELGVLVVAADPDGAAHRFVKRVW